MKWKSVISPESIDALLFDLDGVLTPTAEIHATCWKLMFDEFLQAWSPEHAIPFRPFTIATDYRRYVDGKPRYDGVRSFLDARAIRLPYGHPDDPPGHRSVCSLGNRKNELVTLVLHRDGIEPFPGVVELLQQIRQAGMKTAVVSSSKNCKTVILAAGIEGLFDVRVDGLTIVERGLTGKPAPDMFLEAARQLQVEPGRAAVVEDAISGVQAGAAGNFALVIGIAHGEEAEQLRSHGAHIILRTLGDLL
ncbi:MAG: beta-phosphoglucomutase family hydrolase [Proteobacteria bacterium]|nr:beta-phosphoglucomutase family hydrolase [Pseudomonadota bacterium]